MPTHETNDAAYLIRIAGGDHVALLALYDRYSNILLALAQHILGGAGGEAEELVHEVFLDVWRHADCYHPQYGTVRSWLILRTREHALETMRACPELAAQAAAPGFLTTIDEVDVDDVRTDEQALVDERKAAERLLVSLSDEQRSVLDMAYFTGVDQENIARTLDISAEAVLAHLQAVQQRMRQDLHDLRRL